MVAGSYALIASSATLLAAQQAGDAVIERLDPPRRAAVLMALLGLTLVGLFLITFIMVGAHWVRRLARHRPGDRRIGGNGAASPAVPGPSQPMPDLKSDDTVLLDTSSRETRTGT